MRLAGRRQEDRGRQGRVGGAPDRLLEGRADPRGVVVRLVEVGDEPLTQVVRDRVPQPVPDRCHEIGAAGGLHVADRRVGRVDPLLRPATALHRADIGRVAAVRPCRGHLRQGGRGRNCGRGDGRTCWLDCQAQGEQAGSGQGHHAPQGVHSGQRGDGGMGTCTCFTRPSPRFATYTLSRSPDGGLNHSATTRRLASRFSARLTYCAVLSS